MGGSARRETRTRTWASAFVATLVAHALGILAIVEVDPFSPAPAARAEPDPIRLVFAPPEAPGREPTEFTELPEDRADAPPDRADFLSNVDSRARDHSDHRDESPLPRSDGVTDIAQVEIPDGEPVQVDRTPREHPTEESPRAEPSPSTESSPSDARDAIDVAQTPRGSRPDPDAMPVPPPSRTLEDERLVPIARGDLRQASLSNPAGSIRLAGDVSLNTTQWAWGEWMREFRRDFMPRWLSPSGHLYGLIHGSTLVRVRIAPTGQMLDLVVLDEDGHRELRNASVRAFEAADPFPPLPADFPEEALVLEIKLIYPDLRR